jgi:hypothetical protein
MGDIKDTKEVAYLRFPFDDLSSATVLEKFLLDHPLQGQPQVFVAPDLKKAPASNPSAWTPPTSPDDRATSLPTSAPARDRRSTLHNPGRSWPAPERAKPRHRPSLDAPEPGRPPPSGSLQQGALTMVVEAHLCNLNFPARPRSPARALAEDHGGIVRYTAAPRRATGAAGRLALPRASAAVPGVAARPRRARGLRLRGATRGEERLARRRPPPARHSSNLCA